MGIQGLLPLLKSIMNPIHIKELEGCFVAVDTYSWLHKGALSCSTELCKGQPTSKHIDYCMHRVNMLRHYGVKPILVFDGGPLPMKSDQEIKRARSRRENLARAVENEANGNRSAAYECYQKAVDISPSIAYDFIQVLKQENVSYVVAPYEADAQMTFLAITKQVDAVITEDSDLIAFGCPRIIYKMDKFGQGVEFKNDMLQHNKELNLVGFTQMMLLEMCILSGCDYLQSLPGMGLKKAHTLMKKFKCHENVIKHLKYNSVEVTPLYEESFKKAILTFRHQRVYDPISEEIVHLSEPVDIIGQDSDFLGPSLPQNVAKGIAQGDIDPFTKLPIQGKSCVAEKVVISGTYQLKNFKPDGERKKLELPAQKNLLTNYFCFATIEAKRKFRAPRLTPKHPNENNETLSSHVDLPEVKHDAETDDLKFMSARDSICKPCISLHKVIDSVQANGKATSGNKTGIVRSSYFMKKSREENGKENKNNVDKNVDNNVFSNHVSLEGTCRKEEKREIVKSPYFQHKIKETASCENRNASDDYSVRSHRFDLDAGDSKTTVDNRKHRVRSSYFEEISVKDNSLSESEELGTPSSNSSLDCTIKKRKIAQTDSPIQENENDNNRASAYFQGSGTYSSDLEEETVAEEGKFGCNISHLDRYSDIAEKSIDKFVSVISSFRYNSSGSRASGLRAPLKDIKNNSMKRSTRDVDLTQFAYVPAKETRPSGSRYSKAKA